MNNQLTSYNSGDITFTYDKNGNMTKKTLTGVGDTTYDYDYENRLIRIDYPDSDYSTYRYDGLGRRVEWRDKDGNISRYVYDGQNMIAEYDGSNNAVASYVQSLGIDRPISMYRGAQMYWYHTDALGSVYQMTDEDETVVRTYDYLAFGTIISETGSLTNPFTYTARELDTDSGLYYYRARYYDSSVGRFLSRDPVDDRQVPNKYAYVINNPLAYTDPSGEKWCKLPCPWKNNYNLQSCADWKKALKTQCPGGNANLKITCDGCCAEQGCECWINARSSPGLIKCRSKHTACVGNCDLYNGCLGPDK